MLYNSHLSQPTDVNSNQAEFSCLACMYADFEVGKFFLNKALTLGEPSACKACFF